MLLLLCYRYKSIMKLLNEMWTGLQLYMSASACIWWLLTDRKKHKAPLLFNKSLSHNIQHTRPQMSYCFSKWLCQVPPLQLIPAQRRTSRKVGSATRSHNKLYETMFFLHGHYILHTIYQRWTGTLKLNHLIQHLKYHYHSLGRRITSSVHCLVQCFQICTGISFLQLRVSFSVEKSSFSQKIHPMYPKKEKVALETRMMFDSEHSELYDMTAKLYHQYSFVE